MDNHQIDSNLHLDLAQSAAYNEYKNRKTFLCRSGATYPSSKGRKQLQLTAALNYMNSLEEKESALTTVRINIQTEKDVYFGMEGVPAHGRGAGIS